MRAIPKLLIGLFISLEGISTQAETLTVSIPNGLSTISNPFDHGDNKIGSLLSSVPEGLQLYTFDASTQRWKINQFQFGEWADTNQTLAPHQSAFLQNPTNAFSLTFSGISVPKVPPTISSGYNLISSLPAPELFDALYVWNPTNQDYAASIFYFGGWSTTPPPLNLGEALMYKRGESAGASSNWLYINNYIPASGVDSAIKSTLGCIGTNLFAQLFGYAGTDPLGVPLPIGVRIPVRVRDQKFGYIDPSGSPLILLPQPVTWTFEMRFWDARDGTNYPTATAGRSKRFSCPVNAGILYPPNNLTNLPPILDGPVSPLWTFRDPNFNQIVIEGQRVEFYLATAESYHSGFSFQWQKEAGSNNWVNIDGATATNLVMTSVTTSESGRYRLTAVLDSCQCLNYEENIRDLNVVLFRTLTVVPSPNSVSINGLLGTNLSIALDYSDNLIEWTQLKILSNAPVEWTVTDTNLPLPPSRFYRAHLVK